MREYTITSPSLEGILRHDSIVYEGLHRPEEILRIMDGPSVRGKKKSSTPAPDISDDVVYTEHQQKIIEQYFQDLYGIFMKKLSQFIITADSDIELSLKLQAMLQELIKIKALMNQYT